MLGVLYRYPHPTIPNAWIYCGQGSKRDASHRRGITSFGRRFKKIFPGVELPLPTREEVEITNQFELNALETAWIHKYKTWYENGGMNLIFPGSQDYFNIGKIGGKTNARNKTGICGRTPEKMSEDGHKGGRIAGRISVETGRLAHLRTKEHQSKAGRLAARITNSKLTHEQRQKAGRLTVQKTTSEQRQAWGRLGGLLGGYHSTHKRWHVDRGIVNLNCEVCRNALFPTS